MGIEENVAPGSILCLKVCFPHDLQPKDKYFVVAGIDDSPLLMKINTSQKQIEMGKRFSEYQFKIKKSIYTFLDHDSYIDCGTIWNLLTTEEIIEQITNDPRRIKGFIIDDHVNEIIRLSGKSKSISNRQKSRIRELRKK